MAVSDAINASENHVFVSNVVHVISQLSDSLIMACGGETSLLSLSSILVRDSKKTMILQVSFPSSRQPPPPTLSWRSRTPVSR